MPLTQYMLTIIGFSLVTGVLAIIVTRLSAHMLRIEACDRPLLTVLAVTISGLSGYFGLACLLVALHPDWPQLIACCFLSLGLSLIMPLVLLGCAAWSRYEKLVCDCIERTCW